MWLKALNCKVCSFKKKVGKGPEETFLQRKHKDG